MESTVSICNMWHRTDGKRRDGNIVDKIAFWFEGEEYMLVRRVLIYLPKDLLVYIDIYNWKKVEKKQEE